MKFNNAVKVGAILGFLTLISVFIAGPFAIIWGLNTLFPVLAINYGFWQWIAVLFLYMITFGAINGKLDKINKE